MQLKTIDYGSDRYQETLDLRNRVMKQPLNLDIRDEDLSGEESGYVVGAFDGEQLLGMGSLSYVNEKRAKVDYLCVDTEIQASGVGSNLLMAMETEARYQKRAEVVLEARVSAQKFYEKKGYEPFGEVYLLDNAPIEHIWMIKFL